MKKLLALLCFGVKGIGMAKPKKNVFSDPTPAELEMLAETGKPIKRPAAQGIADMEARIALLTDQMQKLLHQMEMKESSELGRTYQELKGQLQEAKERLAEYQTQKEGLN